jgi:hypothetical protein
MGLLGVTVATEENGGENKATRGFVPNLLVCVLTTHVIQPPHRT